MKKIITIVVGILSILLLACDNKAQEMTEEKSSDLPSGQLSISMDSLRKIGINITLWTESKEDYETLIHDTLEETEWRNCNFVIDVSGAYEFQWPTLKRYMTWRGTKEELRILKNSSDHSFVVIGFYDDSIDRGRLLRFIGDVYKQKKINKKK
ncbi:MAG: hypothetical protein NTY80_01965 [candidate division SR1 bacterium]|nr:hypothetical protein [candidate division SR1 bacterium]